ncbi:MAG TPA: SMP-30/gluconolactonase/LRE family protein [Panacibacter sp.]|nr:SMP-30/gluconolactonase/LRE family protein [Panacibacter sp.]HNP43416.1 SMP-30/gluconolactonase/LRE family protein [Panacibacter sp.]
MKQSVPPSPGILDRQNQLHENNRRHFLKTAMTTFAGGLIAPSLLAAGHDTAEVAEKGYPDPSIIILDERFKKYVQLNAAVERLWTGGRWTEGPVWFGDGRYLLFSDIPNNVMLRWNEETGEVSKFRSPANYSNGNTRDRQGRLISCEHDSRRVTRTELDGTITTLIDNYQGRKFNAPNDVVVHTNGSIWFTDPGYGILSNYEGHVDKFELPTNVYRLDPSTGDITVVADDFARPNGLCFSPDEKLLYIADTGQPKDKPNPIRVFDVVNGKELKNGKMFCDMGKGLADGIRCDTDGNVWASAGWVGKDYDGVHVFAPDGKMIGQVLLPEACANLCFGGLKKNRLFMTASTSVYSLYVNAQGAQRP